jgi:hypothetical protein
VQRAKKVDDKYMCTGPLKHKVDKQIARVAPAGFTFFDANDPKQASASRQ